MKNCPTCNNQLEDHQAFCSNCGTSFNQQQTQYQNQYQQNQQQAPMYAPQGQYNSYNTNQNDHTAEFEPKDISENKIIAMMLYLLSFLGIIIALFYKDKSAYVKFHLHIAFKFLITEALLGIAIGVLFWTFIVPILGGIAFTALWVIKIICFFQVCSGKACDPPIIRSIKFYN